jgi:hypothetical protein
MKTIFGFLALAFTLTVATNGQTVSTQTSGTPAYGRILPASELKQSPALQQSSTPAVMPPTISESSQKSGNAPFIKKAFQSTTAQ